MEAYTELDVLLRLTALKQQAERDGRPFDFVQGVVAAARALVPDHEPMAEPCMEDTGEADAA